jgi:multiple sugar transport system substrate-binding protein
MTLRRRHALGGLLATALLGCSKPPANSITMAMWAGLPVEAAAMEAGMASFMAASGVNVKRNVITDKYMDVMRSRFASRKTPDVFYLDAHEAPFLIKSGVLLPFEAPEDRLDDLYPQFVNAYRGTDGKVYGIPKDCSTLALFVNTALLSKAGFALTDVPREHEALLVFVRKLQKKLPTGHAAMIYERDLARHLSAIEAYGEPVIDERGNARLANNVGALAYLESFVKGRLDGALLSPKDDLGFDSPGAAFGSGRVVFMMEGNWALGSMRQDFPDVRFATLEMPTVNGKHHTMAFTAAYAVSRFAANPSAGFGFARHMTGPGVVEWTRRVGFLPTRPSVSATLKPEFDAPMQAHVAGLAYATVWSRGTSLPVIDSNFGNQFQAALNGSKTVKAALAAAEQAANREIERQR